MDKNEIIIFSGIGMALIWLLACVIIEEKKRRNVIIAGVVIDIVLFLICRKCDFLLAGILGGFIFGLLPLSPAKYKNAVMEFHGVRNLVKIFIIFYVMILMAVGIAYPEVHFTF